MFNKKKVLFVILGWLISSAILYAFLGKMGAPMKFQRALTLDQNSIYDKSEGFEKRDGFIISNGKNPKLIIETNGRSYKYMTIYVSLVNISSDEEAVIIKRYPDKDYDKVASKRWTECNIFCKR